MAGLDPAIMPWPQSLTPAAPVVHRVELLPWKAISHAPPAMPVIAGLEAFAIANPSRPLPLLPVVVRTPSGPCPVSPVAAVP